MEQNRELALAFDFIEKTNRNVFLTGKAGTGKTTFLQRINKESFKRLVVVAPTGVAAINAKGVTIHSFFQLPFDPFIPGRNNLQRKFGKNKIDIIRSLDLLIIDEVSMVRADVLDAIDEVLRRFKDRNKPFGGVHLLLIGDLQQLSPVVLPHEWQLLKEYYTTTYFFSSKAYQKANILAIELKHIYRQQNQQFIDILNEVRNDKLSAASAALLFKQYQPDFNPEKERGYITLTTHNNRADAINSKELEALNSKPRTYKAKIWGSFGENNYPNSEKLTLKKGAQVMFIKNDSLPEKRYYNGKIGVITALDEDSVTVSCGAGDIIETTTETWENTNYILDSETQEISSEVAGTFEQIPLRLAWAITIHKSQGLTFDKAIIDAEASFAHGQTYVALSRCRTLEGIVLKTPVTETGIISDSKINNFTQTIEENPPGEDELATAKKLFQLDLMAEVFDYYSMLYPIKKVLDVYHANKNILHGNLLQTLETLKEKGIMPLLKVGAAFKNQLVGMSAGIEDPEADEKVQERIKKAVAYFKEQTQEYLIDVLEMLTFSTDNKAVKKDIEKNLKDLENTVALKYKVLQGLTDGFSPQEYLKIRAKAILGTEGAKVKRRNVAASAENEELFEELRLFRLSVSNSEDIPPFQVFTQKSLYEMCEVLPSTKNQLKKVHGMGKVRIEKYGEEILEIIADYCERKKIIPQEEVIGIIKQKKNTKDISLQFFNEGLSVKEIAKKRALAESTIESHLAHFVNEGVLEITELLPEEKITKGLELINNNSFEGLSDLKALAGDDFSYGELKMLVNYSASS